MQHTQINITLGTAGHIDHGKTALVKCLTGCDTDRLKEEKERGMSIELGYAPCTIADLEVGIVDVPGHERFVKTMVAGASGIDAVMLVVAADDGIMPQTREHMEILTLLGIEHGLVALTKIDRVDADHLELVRSDLKHFLRGTFLEDAPILPVSNVTGQGYDAFIETLTAMVAKIRPKRLDGVFRLPLERAFSVKGHGTVVAGIPISGSARIGDEVVLLPQGEAGRVRRIEVYGRTSEVVKAGQCAAINVGHWEHTTIGRGDTVTLPGYFTPAEWYVCQLRLLPREKLLLKNGAEIKFHTGTSELPGSIYALEGDSLAGAGEHIVQIHTHTPLVAGPGDHFIIRELSPVQTIGGGTIIEATQRRLKRKRPGLLEDLQARAAAVHDEGRFVEYCLRTAESHAASPTDLAFRTKVRQDRVREIVARLVQQGTALAIGPDLYVHRETAVETGRRMVELVAEHHRQSPQSPGMTLDELRHASYLDKAIVEGLVAMLKTEKRLVDRSGRLATPEHRTTFRDDEARQLEAVESLFQNAPFHPPGVEEVVAQTRLPKPTVEKLLKLLKEHQRIIQIEGLLFHCDAIARARQLLTEYIQREGKLESVQFKYLLDTARKYAIPLLDYFDRVGVTRKVGHTRYLKTPPGSR
jgi:selenocysteine-specific elongation factor